MGWPGSHRSRPPCRCQAGKWAAYPNSSGRHHNVLGQGQKWMSVAQADKRAKQDGFARYRERFGDAWVETRTVDGDEQVRLKPLGEYRTLFERPGRFLLIQGEEITDHFEKKPIHMNASNLLELIKPQGGKSVAEIDGQQPRRRRGAGPSGWDGPSWAT